MRLTPGLLSNYFKRYVERAMHKPTLRRKWRPLTGWQEMKKKPHEFVYDENRPWTDGFLEKNRAAKKPLYRIQPIKDWTVFKGDQVMLNCGKDKGKVGIINCIIKERNWVFVEGLNCEYKIEASGGKPVCVREEKPLLVTTQVSLIDPSDGKTTDIDWRFTEEGERVRVSTRTGRILPLPTDAYELDDFVNPKTYVPGDKDTNDKELVKVTFEPKLCTFEEEIMKEMDIKEDRVKAKTYWY